MTEDNVVEFPQNEVPELLVGPFQEWRVVVSGRFIPRLTSFRDGAGVHLVVDRRFCCGPFTEEAAHQAALLAAQAMAIGAGYSNFEADTKDRCFAPLAGRIDPGPGIA